MSSPGKIKQRWKPINSLSNFLEKVAVAIGFIRAGVLSLCNMYAVLMHRTPERCKEPLIFGWWCGVFSCSSSLAWCNSCYWLIWRWQRPSTAYLHSHTGSRDTLLVPVIMHTKTSMSDMFWVVHVAFIQIPALLRFAQITHVKPGIALVASDL